MAFCNKCGKEIENGVLCDHCNTSINSAPPQKTARKRNNGCLIAFVIVVGAIILLVLAMASCSKNSGRSDDLDAWTCAQTIVKDKLKSPSSADFCAMKEATIKSNGDKYTITGYVDADNSFGANVRSTFTVTFTLTDKGCENVTCHIS